MKYIKFVGILFLALFSGGYAHAAEHGALHAVPESICGRWIVKKAVMWVTAPHDAYMGMHVDYSSQIMKFGKELVIKNPTYKVSQWSDEKFFEQFRHTDLTDIGIKSSFVTVVDVYKGHIEPPFPGTQIFIRNKSQIITIWNGVFYLLARIGSSCE